MQSAPVRLPGIFFEDAQIKLIKHAEDGMCLACKWSKMELDALQDRGITSWDDFYTQWIGDPQHLASFCHDDNLRDSYKEFGSPRNDWWKHHRAGRYNPEWDPESSRDTNATENEIEDVANPKVEAHKEVWEESGNTGHWLRHECFAQNFQLSTSEARAWGERVVEEERPNTDPSCSWGIINCRVPPSIVNDSR